jgi:hypothetical protein
LEPQLIAGVGTIGKGNAIQSPLNSKSSKGSREISSPDLPQVGPTACMSWHPLFQFEADIQGYIVIPKSVSEERIISNSEVFDFQLSPEEMEEVSLVWSDIYTCADKQLDGLDEYLVTDWDVVDCP